MTSSRTAILTFLLAAIAIGLPTFCVAQQSEDAELFWNSDQSLFGSIGDSDDQQLEWHASTLFLDPVLIPINRLKAIRLSASTEHYQTDEPYQVELLDGSVLFGTITRLDDSQLEMRANRFGKIAVKRSHVRSILNLEKSKRVWSAMNLDDWQAMPPEAKAHWKLDAGSFQCNAADSHLFREFDSTRSFRIDFCLQWNKTPDFFVAIGVPEKGKTIGSLPKLETWGNDLMFSQGDDLSPIVMLDHQAKTMRLAIQYNKQDNSISILDSNRRVLHNAKITGDPSEQLGLCFGNRQGDLIIRTLSYAPVQEKSAADAARQNEAGTSLQALPLSFDGQWWTVRDADSKDSDASGAKETRIGVSDFQGAFVTWQRDETSTALPKESVIKIKFADGMRLDGQLKSIRDKCLTVMPTWSKSAVTVSFEGATRIEFTGSATAKAKPMPHQLFSGTESLRGRLVDDGDHQLKWRTEGTLNDVRLTSGDARIVLKPNFKLAENQQKENVAKKILHPNTLYLKNHDILPCRVTSVDESSVHYESNGVKRLVDRKVVKAISLGSEVVPEKLEVTDPSWTSLPQTESCKTNEGQFTFKTEQTICHPYLFCSGEFEFELNRNGESIIGLECGVLPDEIGDGELLVRKKLSLFHILTMPNRMSMSSNPFVPAIDKWTLTDASTLHINVKLVANKVVVTINETHIIEFPRVIATAADNGLGVYFKVFHPIRTDKKAEAESYVSLSNFRRNSSRTNPVDFVNPRRMELALTIPRLKQSSPPPIILCSTNGDLLRGTVLSMDGESVVVNVHGLKRKIERKLISSIIWTGKHSSMLNEADFVEYDFVQSNPINEKHELNSSNHQTNKIQIWDVGERRTTGEQTTWNSDGESPASLVGTSATLGDSAIELDSVIELRIGAAIQDAKSFPFSNWAARFTRQPIIPGPDTDIKVADSAPHGSIGTPVDSFNATMIDGTVVTLEDLQGKVVVLDFWATWCGPCVKGLPELIKVVDSFPKASVIFIAVNQKESADVIKAFLKKKELECPVSLDPGPLAHQFEVEGLPSTIVIDPSGKIAYRKTGFDPRVGFSKLKTVIDELVK